MLIHNEDTNQIPPHPPSLEKKTPTSVLTYTRISTRTVIQTTLIQATKMVAANSLVTG